VKRKIVMKKKAQKLFDREELRGKEGDLGSTELSKRTSENLWMERRESMKKKKKKAKKGSLSKGHRKTKLK